MLAILGGAVGLLVTASAVMLIWLFMQRKQRNRSGEETQESPLAGLSSMLLQWTYFDYALIAVFAIGSLFLFTDAVAVIRDAASYPLYHYGYLLCGFVFTLLGMLFMILRLGVVLSLIRTGRAGLAPDHHRHPGDADQTE
ncbi:hypothetical protein SK3146_01921 [Paenibacillus konkukensis]|uniref:Uncharacterized protein n=2 Tax=Paenibacillus TaxID=44249 RepID=A0ABY4RJX8_9BACL|nr:hypothetical protein SK3146_01921 [Paenibacillus konkukensis]